MCYAMTVSDGTSALREHRGPSEGFTELPRFYDTTALAYHEGPAFRSEVSTNIWQRLAERRAQAPDSAGE